MQISPDPDDYRHLEEAVEDHFTSLGFDVLRTGQEYVGGTLGRWSPDFWVSAGFWCDAKLRNRGYRHFLIEDADLDRHTTMFPGTLYVYVADDPIEIIGWITAEQASQHALERRVDHVRPGSSDPYRLVLARYLQPIDRLLEHVKVDSLWRWL